MLFKDNFVLGSTFDMTNPIIESFNKMDSTFYNELTSCDVVTLLHWNVDAHSLNARDSRSYTVIKIPRSEMKTRVLSRTHDKSLRVWHITLLILWWEEKKTFKENSMKLLFKFMKIYVAVWMKDSFHNIMTMEFHYLQPLSVEKKIEALKLEIHWFRQQSQDKCWPFTFLKFF